VFVQRPSTTGTYIICPTRAAVVLHTSVFCLVLGLVTVVVLCLQSLVGLNFNQEAVEADMRYGLVRVRENAESIAFYGGQANEMAALKEVSVGAGCVCWDGSSTARQLEPSQQQGDVLCDSAPLEGREIRVCCVQERCVTPVKHHTRS
jgi:hypothetical protein